MSIKEILGVAAIAITVIAFLPYIRAILKGKTKPHIFSWIIWGSTTFIVFLAQYADNGGAGAWPIGVSGLITLYVAWLAYKKKADSSITRLDWVFFAFAMAALPLWAITSSPLWAVILLTSVDLAGFGPTITKAYRFPFEEQLTFFVLMMLRNLISIAALEHYSLTTVLFPAAVALACALFIAMVAQRRYVFRNEAS